MRQKGSGGGLVPAFEFDDTNVCSVPKADLRAMSFASISLWIV
jgi:hypothetical protein